jgi:polyphenol oxidase
MELIRFNNLSRFKEMTHFISTRNGGVSTGLFSSLNLSFGVDDDPKKVLQNRYLLSESVGIPLKNFVFGRQVHGNQVKVITTADKGKGSNSRLTAFCDTDAFVTNTPGICMMVLAADCVPLIFYDPQTKTAGITHAGWRGTLKRIAQQTVLAMKEQSGSDTRNIIAGIGPSIGPCCNETGEEVVEEVINTYGNHHGHIIKNPLTGKSHFDLWYSNTFQLLELGIKKENIELANLCTHCHTETFFSARYDKARSGRFGAGIIIWPDDM